MKLLIISISLLYSVLANAEYVQPGTSLFIEKFTPYKEPVNQAINTLWPSLTLRSYIPSQIEQESCISAKHKKCWNPTVELKTSREYGFGLGQFTIAYKADGSVRFNAWEEIKVKDKLLKDWQWEDRFNPLKQIQAIVIKNRINYSKITFPVKNELTRLAFTAVTYNSGSVMKDRSLCLARSDCDASAWFVKDSSKRYAVESFSTKSKVAQKGYGKSFFEISREYPYNVLYLRRMKYVKYTGN
jgi:hypothetical protein